MPTREVRLRRIAKKQEQERLDKLYAEIPDHIRQRLGATPLNNAILAVEMDRRYNLGGGLGVAVEGGDFGVNRQAVERGIPTSARTRRQKADDAARDLRDRYRDVWMKPGAAEWIAREEEIAHSTIYRYIKKFPLD